MANHSGRSHREEAYASHLPQVPLSVRSPQREATPPLKSSQGLRAEALVQLSCPSNSYEDDFVIRLTITDSNSEDHKSINRHHLAGTKLPPLARSAFSHGDLSTLDVSTKSNIAFISPTVPKTPILWNRSKSLSPSPSSQQEFFNIPQHGLTSFDQHKVLRRPRSPTDEISRPLSMTMLLKASLTPKTANETFFADTVDAETVEIKVSNSVSNDETVTEKFLYPSR